MATITCPTCDGSGLITSERCKGEDCDDVGFCDRCDQRYTVDVCQNCYGFGWVWDWSNDEGDNY